MVWAERTACRASVAPTGTVSSQVLSLASAANPGDVVVVALAVGGSNTTASASGLGATWTVAKRVSTNSPTLVVFVGTGITASGTDITLSNLATTTMSAVATVFTGLVDDPSVIGPTGSSTSSAATTTTTSAVSATLNRLLIGAASHGGPTGADINVPTWSNSGSNTRIATVAGGNSPTLRHSALDYTTSTTASVTATYTSPTSAAFSAATVELIPAVIIALPASGTRSRAGSGTLAITVGDLIASGSRARGGSAALRLDPGIIATGARHRGGSTALTVSPRITAAGSRHRGGSATLALGVSLAPPAGTMPGYQPNGRIRGGQAFLTIDPAILPAPTGSVVLPIPTVSNHYARPVLVDGQPYADADLTPWQPLDGEGTHDVWGNLRVIVAGRDRTWFRGVKTIVADYSDADPGGDDTATIIFPAITSFDELGTGDLDWLNADAEIRIQKRNPDGTIAGDVFEGEIGVEEDALTTGSGTDPASVGTFHCRGLWLVLDDWITLPRSKPDPIESAEWIEDLVRRAHHYGFPGHMPASNVTGIRTGERGEYGAPLKSQTIVNALKLMQRDDGTVYTVAQRRPKRLVIVERSWGGAPDFRLWVGQRGVSHNLTRDPTLAWTAIFGRGQAGNQAWENWQYPVAYVNPPAYPLDIEAGVFFTPGSSYSGFQDFSDELREHFDYDLDSQDTYLSSDLQTIDDFQEHIGIQVDGIVGPQTWNAAFQIGQNAHVLDDAYIRELWSLSAVQPDLVNSRGGRIGANPGFRPGAFRRRETLIDFGVLGKPTARRSARREGQKTKLPYYVGQIIAENIDPREMPALDTASGMNMRYMAHRGTDRDFHVVRCERDPGMRGPRRVTWTVSEKPDDLMTLAQIIARRKGVRDVVHSIRPQRRSSHRTPDWVPFDSESGAGILHRTAQTAGLWNGYQIPMGEALDVAAVKIIASVPCQMSAAMFNRHVTPDMLTALPGLANPGGGAAGDDPWQANADALNALGIQWSTGGPGAMQGYWPHDPSIDAALTGVLADTAPWPYRTLRPPWGWLLVWTSANCHVSGDPNFRSRAIFPAPEM